MNRSKCGLLIAGLLAALSVPLASPPAVALVEKSKEHRFEIVSVAQGLRYPWSLAFLPDGGMLVTERGGRLLKLSKAGQIEGMVSGLPKIAAVGQGGLLDVVLHPKFSENRLIYFSYAKRGDGGVGTAVARGRLDGRQLSNVETIFEQTPKLRSGVHFGSRLVWLEDGTLLISMGDRGVMKRSQDTSNHQGTIARVADDGSVPKDNPFVGKSGALPEIYTYGNRNVQGMVRDPVTGIVWAHEHGPRGGDELNIIRPGLNYGWPTITYGVNYDGSTITTRRKAPGMEQPVTYWVPSIAPSGMAVYNGDKFPGWKGDIFVGSLKFSHLRRLDMENGKMVGQEELLVDTVGERVRDVRAGPDGHLWVLTDAPDGQLLKLIPKD